MNKAISMMRCKSPQSEPVPPENRGRDFWQFLGKWQFFGQFFALWQFGNFFAFYIFKKLKLKKKLRDSKLQKCHF